MKDWIQIAVIFVALIGLIVAGIFLKDYGVQAAVECEKPVKIELFKGHKDGKKVKVGTECLTDQEYKEYKDKRVQSYKKKTDSERAKYLLTPEGQSLDDVLSHEILSKHDGRLDIGKVEKDDDIFLLIINALEK